MTKATFKANDKVITMGKGNIQFNTSTPEFRAKVQLFCDGINAMNDKRLYYSDCVRTATKSLELYQKGTYVDGTVVEAKTKEIEDYKEAVRAITAEISEKMPSYDETDEKLYYAYRTFINGEEDVPSGNTYLRAFMEWLDNVGIVPTDKGIKFIQSQIGAKKASAKQSCLSGGIKFVAELGKKQYLDLVYRVVGEMMYKCNALKAYTYEYVPAPKTTKKSEKTAA